MASTVHMTCEDVTPMNADGYGNRPTFLSHFVQEPTIDVTHNALQLEHSYAKPWNSFSGFYSHAKPSFLLFMSKHPRPPNIDTQHLEVEEIDVESVEDVNIAPYDQQKACSLMNECERNVNFARAEVIPDDLWEDRINRDGWTISQTRLFNRVVKSLQADRLARLAFCGNSNEPIMRRLCVNKTAKRVRFVLASAMCDPSVMQWLHRTLLASLGQSMLAVYLDVLQVLQSKSPHLVGTLLSSAAEESREDKSSNEALRLLLKRPWDPVGSFLSLHRLSKLPGGLSFVMVPEFPTESVDSQRQPASVWRTKFWNSQLSGIGKVTHVSVGVANTISHYFTMTETSVRKKCAELREKYPNRSIVLVGWQAACHIACRVSLMESVTAVVALGFPTQFMSGHICGDADDLILDCRTPVLFVVGQNATTCCIEDLEDMREHMCAKSSMVIVGGADDRLRMSHSRMRSEGVTQRIVDRCILDKISDFLNDVILQLTTGENVPRSKTLSPRKFKVKYMEPSRLSHGQESDAVGSSCTNDAETDDNTTDSVARPQHRVVKRKKRSSLTRSSHMTSTGSNVASVTLAASAAVSVPTVANSGQPVVPAFHAGISHGLNTGITSESLTTASCGMSILQQPLSGLSVGTTGPGWMISSGASIMPATAQIHQLLASLSTARLTNSADYYEPLADGSITCRMPLTASSHSATSTTMTSLPTTFYTHSESEDPSDISSQGLTVSTRTRTVRIPKPYNL